MSETIIKRTIAGYPDNMNVQLTIENGAIHIACPRARRNFCPAYDYAAETPELMMTEFCRNADGADTGIKIKYLQCFTMAPLVRMSMYLEGICKDCITKSRARELLRTGCEVKCR